MQIHQKINEILRGTPCKIYTNVPKGTLVDFAKTHWWVAEVVTCGLGRLVCWDMTWATVYLYMTMPRHMKNDMCAASKLTSSYECMCDIFSFSLHTYLVPLV